MTPSARVRSAGASSRSNLQDSLTRHSASALVPAVLALSFAFESATAASAPPPDDPRESPSSAEALKKLSVEELLNIEVTSVSKRPQKLSEAAAAIQVITGDDIGRSGASSFPEALRLADNLIVTQGTSASWSVSARGFNAAVSNKLLVLIDGRSVYTPLFSGVIWNMQDYLLDDIDRIEVISGPGGTLWGANAVNGVINITSKNARDTQGLYAEMGGGIESQDFIGVRYGGMLAPNVYFRVYGKYFDRAAEVLLRWQQRSGFLESHSRRLSHRRGRNGARHADAFKAMSTRATPTFHPTPRARRAAATCSAAGRTPCQMMLTRPCRCITTGRTSGLPFPPADPFPRAR